MEELKKEIEAIKVQIGLISVILTSYKTRFDSLEGYMKEVNDSFRSVDNVMESMSEDIWTTRCKCE